MNKLVIVLLVLGLSFQYGTAEKRQLSDASSCRTCVENTECWWCREKSMANYSPPGTCCNGNWYGCMTDDQYICSNSAGMEVSSGYLICPEDPGHCGTQNFYIREAGDTETVNQSYVMQSTVCWYKIEVDNDDVNRLNITVNDSYGGQVTIYSEDEESEFSYKWLDQMLSTEYSHYYPQYNVGQSRSGTFKVKEDQTLYLLYTPNSPHSNLSFSVTGDYVKGDDSDVGLIVGVTVGSVLVVLFLVAFVALAFLFFKNYRIVRKAKGIAIEKVPAKNAPPAAGVVVNQNIQHNSFTAEPNNTLLVAGRGIPVNNTAMNHGYPLNPDQVHIEIPAGVPIRINGNQMDPNVLHPQGPTTNPPTKPVQTL